MVSKIRFTYSNQFLILIYIVIKWLSKMQKVQGKQLKILVFFIMHQHSYIFKTRSHPNKPHVWLYFNAHNKCFRNQFDQACLKAWNERNLNKNIQKQLRSILPEGVQHYIEQWKDCFENNTNVIHIKSWLKDHLWPKI